MQKSVFHAFMLGAVCGLTLLFFQCSGSGCSWQRGVKNQAIIQSLTVVPSQEEMPEAAREMRVVVERVNELCKNELGFKKFINFRRYQKEVKTAYALKCAPKDMLYYDYSLSEISGETFETLERAQQRAEELRDRYDIYIYRSDAFAGGYPITDPFISLSPARQIFVIMHEDWHDNIEFSISVEEATGNVLGYVGTIDFLKKESKNRKDIKEAENTLRWTAEKARIVVKYYGILEKLYVTSGIDNSTMMYAREEIFRDAKKECLETEKRTGVHLSGLEFNNATLSNWMTYDRYFDLAWRVYLGMGRDLKKTAAIFRSIRPISDYAWWPRLWMDKEKIQEYESDVVEYLEQFAAPKKMSE